MISFAIGGLLGDVFFHTLPHISEAHNHNSHEGHDDSHSGHSHSDHSHSGHDHSHAGHSHSTTEMLNNFLIIIGIVSFFLIERISRQLLEGDESHSGHSHSGHGHDKKVESSK